MIDASTPDMAGREMVTIAMELVTLHPYCMQASGCIQTVWLDTVGPILKVLMAFFASLSKGPDMLYSASQPQCG